MFIPAESINIAAKLCVMRTNEGNDKNDDKTGGSEWPTHLGVQGDGKILIDLFEEKAVSQTERLRVDDKTQTTGEEHAGERHEESRHFEPKNNTAHQCAVQSTQDKGDGNGDERRDL